MYKLKRLLLSTLMVFTTSVCLPPPPAFALANWNRDRLTKINTDVRTYWESVYPFLKENQAEFVIPRFNKEKWGKYQNLPGYQYLCNPETAIINNAAYCKVNNTIAYHIDGIDLIATTFKSHFDVHFLDTVKFTVAHEYAHHIQNTFHIQLDPPNLELQADCLAGFYMGRNGTINGNYTDLGSALTYMASEIHGNGSLRKIAFEQGYERAKDSPESYCLDEYNRLRKTSTLQKKIAKK